MKFQFEVAQVITVELDESKFTEEFMEEFRAGFFPFYEIEEHAQHIAQLQARGIIDLEGSWNQDTFIEGYGEASDFGLKTEVSRLEIHQFGKPIYLKTPVIP